MFGYGRDTRIVVARAMLVLGACFLSSCSLVRLTGDAVVLSGKVASTAVKTTGVVVSTAGKAGQAGVRLLAGDETVKLRREGNSFLVAARINRRSNAKLLLDTGATNVQISSALARRLGLKLSKANLVRCSLADGSVVLAREVILKEVRVGDVKVKNVRALVLDSQGEDDVAGLLGMSFLNHFVFKIDPQRNLLILRRK